MKLRTKPLAKSTSKPRSPKLDMALHEAFYGFRRGGVPMTQETLRVQAGKIKTLLLADSTLSHIERERLDKLVNSQKLIRLFVKSHGLKSY